MAKTFTAAFAQDPKTFTAVATTAVGSLTGDAPTNTHALVTAGAEGAIVTKITAIPRATVTATALYLFISKDGTTKRLLKSVLMAAHTVAATTEIPVVDFGYSETEPLRLEAGDQLFVGVGVTASSGVVFTAQSTDY